MSAEDRIIITTEGEQRFWSKVDKTGPCWLWMAGRNSEGYGYATFGGVTVGAHRVAYRLSRGPIPDGLQLDHVCRVRHCVNPDHLEPVTRKVNLLRGVNPAAINKRKTHCIRGHEFTPQNTGKSSRGNRQCLICCRASDARRQREARARKKAS